MGEDIAITVIATGFDEKSRIKSEVAKENKSFQSGLNWNGQMDSAPARPAASSPAAPSANKATAKPKPNPEPKPDPKKKVEMPEQEDELDIPAFIRRKMK